MCDGGEGPVADEGHFTADVRATLERRLAAGVEVSRASSPLTLDLIGIELTDGDPSELRIYLRHGNDRYGLVALIDGSLGSRGHSAESVTSVVQAALAHALGKGLPDPAPEQTINWL
jgi:hypothetical protein